MEISAPKLRAEFERWRTAYASKTKILDDRWVVIELCSNGIKEYSAFGKAVRAIWATRRCTLLLLNRISSVQSKVTRVEPWYPGLAAPAPSVLSRTGEGHPFRS